MKAISTSKFVALLAALLLTSAEALILNYDAQHQLLGYQADATSIRQSSDL
ncbi:MAG TPA: hypothetical protein VH109_12555 [Steroidobacteraceae bacterium]|jgi:hypothetical protein|nr:hypothetical protein [Steroidobacteraceae bacterium]